VKATGFCAECGETTLSASAVALAIARRVSPRVRALRFRMARM
jgi:hypothetical protein